MLIVFIVLYLTLGVVFSGAGSKEEEVPCDLGIGAVASNAEGCAQVGGNILRDGGSAVDAIIATLLCEGVMSPHSMGIGGGFIATIYNKAESKVETLIAREIAPAAAHQDMFINKEITGAISCAVPGEIYGYWCLHEKYGRLPWSKLFEASIELCFKGHKVSRHLATILQRNSARLRNEPSMAEIFINPYTNDFYKEGEIMFRPELGRTFQIIAEQGVMAMYGGGIIGKRFVADVQEMGGIITEDDMLNYSVRWEEPIVARFKNGYRLFTTPLPTSGVILAYILNVMESLYTKDHDVYWQRLVETFKHAYGHRTKLGDILFEPEVNEISERLTSEEFAVETRKLIADNKTSIDPSYYGANFTHIEDHGTANVAVLAPNGDAITITSTVNSHLGAKVRSRQTGIILNDEMDDFSTPGVVNTYGIPATPMNYIRPRKIPMSSTCPSIVLDGQGELKLLLGGAGGSKITTAVAQTILRYFVLNQSMEDSVNSGRIHHQLVPMQVDVEQHVPEHTNQYLRSAGHNINYLPPEKAFSALTAIGLKTGLPHPVCDGRRLGSTVTIQNDDCD